MVFDGGVLKDFLRCREMSQAELASLTGLSRSYISELLKGKKLSPKRPIVRKLANALDIAPTSLYLECDDDIADAIKAVLANRAKRAA